MEPHGTTLAAYALSLVSLFLSNYGHPVPKSLAGYGMEGFLGVRQSSWPGMVINLAGRLSPDNYLLK
jgi:hypothetical protein